MSQPLLSVIVPVYGVEKTLDRCMESVVGQSYRDLEIIMVDDKSPDGSPRMCDRWAERDHRVKVIHKAVNEGLGFARNTGMSHATGDFIAFVDSDDYLDRDIYRKMIRTALDRNADIVYMGLQRQMSDRSFVRVSVDKVSEYSADMTKHVVEYIPGVVPSPNLISVCIGVFRRKIAFHLFISEREAVSEDFDWTLRAILKSKKICRIPDAGYFYCYNDTSITHTYNIGDVLRIVRSGEIIRDVLEPVGLGTHAGKYMFLRMLGYQRFSIFGCGMKCAEIRRAIGAIVRNDRYLELLKSMSPDMDGWNLKIIYRLQRTGNVTINLIYGWFDRHVVCDKLGIPRFLKKIRR